MPTIRPGGVTSTTADDLSNRKFSVVPPGGAILNMWIAGVTTGDTFGLSSGDRDIIVNGSEMNVESSADVVDIARDQVAFDELVLPGQLFLPITLSTEVQYLIHLQYLQP
jgi:hypothetical protein|tara:strand:+ start:2887 stop:3216 length:330 start_codon:yes stop_codon:yes gene_type:complete